MNRIKQALNQAHGEGIISKSSVVEGMAVESAARLSKIEGEFFNLDRHLLKRNHVFMGDEANSFAMAYKILRTQVYQKMRQNSWKNLGITSSNHSEGKSLTALNLSLSLARAASHDVVLLDFDLRRPSIDLKLGLNRDVGVSDYFLNNAPLDKIGVRVTDKLTVFPGVESTSDASEILGSTKMKDFISGLRVLYPQSIFIYDLPPALLVDDVLAFSPQLDATIVVAEESRTEADELSRTLELLQLTNLLGVVLNKSGEISTDSYYY